MSDDAHWKNEGLGPEADDDSATRDDLDAATSDPAGGDASDPFGTDEPSGGVPSTKLCVYCVSEIDALATRCNRCAGYLPPAEGTDFKQHWTLLFCCVSIFIACIWLPIEGNRNDLYASHSIAGGFLTIFAGYGMIASWANLFHRKMIVWPALLMAFDGLFVAGRRLTQLISRLLEQETTTKDEWVRMAGPGLWVILLCSTIVFLTFMRGAAAGAKKDKDRKEAMRAQRGGRR